MSKSLSPQKNLELKRKEILKCILGTDNTAIKSHNYRSTDWEFECRTDCVSL